MKKRKYKVNTRNMVSKIKNGAAIVFGLVFPAIFLLFAFVSLQLLPEPQNSDVNESFKKIKTTLEGPNDYALYSLLVLEDGLKEMTINKQVMKSVLIQIGFALISVGIMFIVLGINEGSIEGSGSVYGSSINFRTSGTGAAVIIIGALLISLGAVPNKHVANSIPAYIGSGSGFAYSFNPDEINFFIKECEKVVSSEDKASCLLEIFEVSFGLEGEK